jgi:hypothetical protein
MAIPNKENERMKLGWPQEEIDALELSFLKEILSCKDKLGVSAAVRYAAFMTKKVGLNSDNYPVFFELIETGNQWVVNTLLGDQVPETFFKPVQLNSFMIGECLRMLTNWQAGGVYPKALQIIFGILKLGYDNPVEGYRMYPLNIPEVNNLGKHLNKEKDQRDSVNRVILSILDKVASLVEPGKEIKDKATLDVATQANNIRGKFLDLEKTLDEAIPELLLKKGDYTQFEVAPEE